MAKNNAPTLEAYAKSERRKTCAVCKLPDPIRKQIRDRKEGITLAMVVSWLRPLGHRVTERQLAGHFRQGHDR